MDHRELKPSLLMEGTFHSTSYEGWIISWETNPGYRHWCSQVKDPEWPTLLFVMLNPGSLGGDGEKLGSDTTLRDIRAVCEEAEVNSFILNLFDFVTAKPAELAEHWHKRDFRNRNLIYDKVNSEHFLGVAFAWGDYKSEQSPLLRYSKAIENRITQVEKQFSALNVLRLPKNKNDSPRHPRSWKPYHQLQEVSMVIREAVLEQKIDAAQQKDIWKAGICT